jgi:hypothetical protein
MSAKRKREKKNKTKSNDRLSGDTVSFQSHCRILLSNRRPKLRGSSHIDDPRIPVVESASLNEVGQQGRLFIEVVFQMDPLLG